MQDNPPHRDDRLSLAERLAHRLLAREPASPPALDATVSPPEPAPPPPIVADAPPAPEPAPAEPRPVIEIDFARLQAAGFITPTSQRSQQIESFRTIKRNLLKVAFGEGATIPENNANVIMVTSAAPGEGKTFIALNLAMSISIERDLFVLLIDGDSARRSLGQLLGVQQERGLVDLLAEAKHDVGDIILRTNVPNLSFMPAGRPHTHGTELLSSKQMGALMRDIGARYPDRVIIIDTSPVMATNEGVVLSSYVGQIVVVVEKDVTTRKNLQRTLSVLKGGGNISCVFNREIYEHNYPEYGY